MTREECKRRVEDLTDYLSLGYGMANTIAAVRVKAVMSLIDSIYDDFEKKEE